MPTAIPRFAQDSAAELYLGFFGRAPDTAGFIYWANQIASGVNALTVAQGFAQSPEFIAQYANLSHRDQVTQIYHHVLERDPDPDGLNYWAAFLDAGSSIGKVVWDVIEAAFHQVGTPDGLLVQEKIYSAQAYMAPIASNQASVPWSVTTGFGQANVGQALSAVLDGPVSGSSTVVVNGSIKQWQLNAMNFQSAWSAGYTGKGVIIAQIDTGVDLSNHTLTQNLSPYSWNFVNNSANVQDDNGHGSAVASVLVGSSVPGQTATILGGAYGAQLMVLKAADANGAMQEINLVNAINYAVAHGADVINLSLGGNAPSGAQLEAITNAVNHGVIVCMAAGNSAATTPQYPAGFSSSLTSAIAVGASTQTDLGTYALASFSNHAGSLVPYNFVDAPGSNILAYGLNGQLRYWSGSSIATPLISAEAAVLLSANTGLNAEQIVQAIVHDTIEIIGVQSPII